MKALVTGGTGFIGRRLVNYLVRQYGASNVWCFVKTSTKTAETDALERFRTSGVNLIYGDLLDSPVTPSPPPAVDVVFHLAANIDTDTPEEEHLVNDKGTANLLDWLGPVLRGCRIVYTSSVAVMDRCGVAEGPLRENGACTPRTAYGVTKLRGEAILRDRAPAAGYTWTILRFPTVYGQGEKTGGMFDLIINSARNGTLISRLNWPGRTSVMFIEDAVAILHDVASRRDAANELFMVSSGEDCTIADIAREAGRIVGRPVRPIRVPSVVWHAMRRIVWLPLVRRAVPRAAQVSYWRLTLIVDDGFWLDPSRLLSRYPRPMVRLDEGLQRTITGEHADLREERKEALS